MSHIGMGRVARMNESCCTYERYMSIYAYIHRQCYGYLAALDQGNWTHEMRAIVDTDECRCVALCCSVLQCVVL